MRTIGLDLGGTKVLGVLVNDGEVEAREKVSTPRGGPPAVMESLAAVVDRLGGASDVAGVGLGGPGQVADGRLGPAPNLDDWDEPYPVAEELSAALGGAPVRVENDVNVAALGEQRLGAGRGCRDLLAVFQGTGVGGGLILDGRLRRGPHGLAGELGHMIVDLGDRECGCGGLGHLEAYAGRMSLERTARALHEAGTPTALVDIAGSRRMKSKVFEQALAAEDPVAQRLVAEAAEAMGAAIASVTVLVDIELVVLGGGLAERLGDSFRASVEDIANRRIFGETTVEIVEAELGELSGALGAALLFTE